MPKANKFSILGLEVKKDTPTVEEWTMQWGADSLLSEATSNVWYRGTAAEARDLFLHGCTEEKDDKGTVTQKARKGVDDLTGIQRQFTTTKSEKTQKNIETWSESEQKFFNRVCATLVEQKKFVDVDAAKLSFAPLLQECVDLTAFDASRPVPVPLKAKTISAVFTDAAKAAVAKGNGGKLAKFLSKELGVAVEPTEEALARAMKAHEEKIIAAQRASLKALAG